MATIKKFLQYTFIQASSSGLKKMLFDDDDDDTVATAKSFDEASNCFNASAKETHITDEHRTTPLNSENRFNDQTYADEPHVGSRDYCT